MRVRILLVFIILSISGKAQDMLMYSNSTWAGASSMLLNPAMPVLSPLYLDLNLLTANVSIENNYIYIPSSENKFRRFFRDINYSGENSNSTEKFYFDYYTPEMKSFFINVRITGPSASLILGKHAFSFQTSVRSLTSVKDIPGPLAKLLYEGMYWPQQHYIRYTHKNKMSVAHLSWAELGLNYSHIFKIRDKNIWAGGITIKKLSGYGGAVFFSDHLDYMMQGPDTLKIYTIDTEGGYSLPVDYNSNDFQDNKYNRGRGFSLDLGFSFEKKKRSPGWINRFSKPCTQYFTPYKYRIGISLLDIGKIEFTKNARKFKVDDGSLFWPGLRDINNTTVSAFEDSISDHFFGNYTQLIISDKFSMDLPASISVQTDINLVKYWYFSTTTIVPVSNKRSVQIPAVILGGLRFESKHASLGLNASLYDWSKIHVGVMGRFESFFIGTDNLLSFMQINDYTGTNIYAGIKLSLNKGRCSFVTSGCPGQVW